MHLRHNAIDAGFIGRGRELTALNTRASRPGGQLVLLYGRRRIGKSYLLGRFAEDYTTIYYQATQQSEQAELESFTAIVRGVMGDDRLPEGYSFPTWEVGLDFIASNATPPRLVIILDEFPYLVDSTPGLASVLQRWWDKTGRNSLVMLILCGSAQSFMAALDDEAAPLHQRFTAKIQLGPLSYREAAEFTPSLTPSDKAIVYGILGGTPLYLRQWDQTQSIQENLYALFADSSSSLLDAAELILSTDLADSKAPYRILAAVGAGRTRFSEIRDFAKVQERAFQRLVSLNMLQRRIPATDHPENSKRSIYEIGDPYLRFYFRFIARARGAIGRGLGVNVVNDHILPYLDTYMGGIFEDIARDFVRALMRKEEIDGDDVSTWWSTNSQHEIDIVGTQNIKTVTCVGSVKWQKEPVGWTELNALQKSAAALGVPENTLKLLVGRGGMDARLTSTPHVRGVSAEQLYE